MSGQCRYPFKSGDNTLGKFNKASSGEPPNIILNGVGIGTPHCIVTYDSDERKAIIQPNPEDYSRFRVKINGEVLAEPQELRHGDRVMVGTHFYYLYVDPRVDPEESFGYEEAV
jgi:hypothetical protein